MRKRVVIYTQYSFLLNICKEVSWKVNRGQPVFSRRYSGKEGPYDPTCNGNAHENLAEK